ncbi:hypothetical protein QEH56_06845 [Pelagicoccus enzymogenes]|uniref:hypothetical protein n=1 Tax=Pelagicoccus enzymogenes TaxID=2773457 RepID=UPI00280FB0D3|nr:hypothetical protein [Pelagicoccus enzymogenes]MDQ8197856.1 hypothetical protein [Pelagicoccus enzymogenes]
MLKSQIIPCLLVVALVGCSAVQDYYKPPANRTAQAGVKTLLFGNARTIARSLPTTGMVRISQIDGKLVYFEAKEFKELMANEFFGDESFVGVSAGLTEFQIEFIFKSEGGGGFFCRGSLLAEIEPGKRYEPQVSFDQGEGVFRYWMKDADTGEAASEARQGEWSELDESDFTRLVGDWIRQSPRIGFEDIYGSSTEDRTMLSAETPKDFDPPMPPDHTGDAGGNSTGSD